MKNERGITLASLMVYLVALAMIILTVTNITRYFYTNVTHTEDTTEYADDYLAFLELITKEINEEENYIFENNIDKENEGAEDETIIQKYVIFSKTYNQYTFIPEDKAIYKNQEKICENVENCEFISQDKTQLTVEIRMKGMEELYTTTYTIRTY